MAIVQNWGDRFNPALDGNQQGQIASLKSGHYVSVWATAREPEGAKNTLYYQTYNADGYKNWQQALSITGTDVGNIESPTVTGLSNGWFVISWAQARLSPADVNGLRYETHYDIMAAIVDVHGTVIRSPTAILKGTSNTSSTTSYLDPVVTALDNADFAVSYTKKSVSGTTLSTTYNSSVFSQTFTQKANANPSYQPITTPDVVDIGDGKYIVVTAKPSSDANTEVWAEIRLKSNNSVYDSKMLSFTSKDKYTSGEGIAISSQGDAEWFGSRNWQGKFVAAEMNFNSLALFVRDYHGNPIGKPYEYIEPIYGTISKFAVSALLDGTYAVAWADGNVLRVAVYSQTGDILKSARDVATLSSTERYRNLSLDALEDGRFTLTWSVANDTSLNGYTRAEMFDSRLSDTTAIGINWTQSASDPFKSKQFAGTALADTLNGGDGDDTIYGYWGHDKIDGGDNNDVLFGGRNNDTLIGSGGNDQLYGEDGNDTLEGGEGNDYFHGGDGTADRINYINSATAVKAFRFDPVTHNNGVSAKGDTYDNASIEELQGSNHADTLGGWWEAELILGEGGDDIIDGYQGNDTLYGGTGKDYLSGNLDNDKLYGEAGDDTLEGGGGGDELYGGNEFDWATYENAGVRVITWLDDKANPTGQTKKTGEAEGDTYSSIEGLIGSRHDDILGGDGSGNSLRGLGGSDVLFGGDGNDTLDGGTQDDAMIGGRGNDTYYVDHLLDLIEESTASSGGQDIAYISGSYELADNVGVETLEAADKNSHVYIRGNNLANTIIGSNKDDILSGGGGGDVLRGGAGNDTYRITEWRDFIEEGAAVAGNVDRAVLFITAYTLDSAAQVEVIEADASMDGYALTIKGSDYANTIYGGRANDSLHGAGGADSIVAGIGDDSLDGGQDGRNTLDGGAGNDKYYVSLGDIIQDSAADSGYDIAYVNGSFTLNAGAAVEELNAVSLDSSIKGNEFVNSITGSTGADQLSGGKNSAGLAGDTLDGGAGTDYYVVYNANDVIKDSEGYDTLTVSVNTYTLNEGAEIEVINVDPSKRSQKFNITGNSGNSIITGGDNDDTLNGGGGEDLLLGGDGNDTYIITDPNTTINDTQGNNKVYTSVSYDLSKQASGSTIVLLEADTSVGSTGLELIGNAYANRIVGYNGADTLDGGAGSGRDTLVGGNGGDTYIIRSTDTVIEETGADGTDTVKTRVSYTLTAGAAIEELHADADGDLRLGGNELTNTIVGGAGNNLLSGGGVSKAGEKDVLRGLGGDDIYIVTGYDVTVDETSPGSAGENDTVQLQGPLFGTSGYTTYTLEEGVEILDARGVTAGGMQLTGNALGNYILGSSKSDELNGGAGSDTLDGGGGGDIMRGGTGDDTYIVRRTTDVIEEDVSADGGHDTVEVYTTGFTLGEGVGIETIKVASSSIYNVSLTGNSLSNTLIGGNGNDTLNGGGKGAAGEGADSMAGGAGNDTYFINHLDDVVSEAIDGGTDDTAYVIEGYDISKLTNVEHIFIVKGKDGPDTMGPSDADDIYIINDPGDVIIESTLDSGGFDKALIFIDEYKLDDTVGVEVLEVGAGVTRGLKLTGNILANTLIGGVGNDTLDGGGAPSGKVDILRGGQGDDTYVVRDPALVSIEETDGTVNGRDTILLVNTRATSFSLESYEHIETLEAGSGTGKITLTGNSADNLLKGNASANTLEGGVGRDTLSGGKGDDLYLLTGDDRIIELEDEGYDTARATTNYTLAAGVHVERLEASAAGLSLAGNELDNHLVGTSGADFLSGRAGRDTLEGGHGADTYYVYDADELIIEGDDPDDRVVDRLYLGTDAYTLDAAAKVEWIDLLAEMTVKNVSIKGSDSFNRITTGTGNDTLDGAGGDDQLNGGTGNDTYVIDSLGDQITESADTLKGGEDTVIVKGAGLGALYTLADKILIENLSADASTGEIELVGNALHNKLTGNVSANTLQGADGDDTLDGGGGKDLLVGGIGNDVYRIRHADDVIEEDPAITDGVNDVVEVFAYKYQLGVDAGVEVMRAAHAKRGAHLIGNGHVKILQGGGYDDILDGGLAADGSSFGPHSLEGGAGNDIYLIRHASDVVLTDTGGSADRAYLFTKDFGGSFEAALLYKTYLEGQGIEDVRIDEVPDLNRAPIADAIELSSVRIREQQAGLTLGVLTGDDPDEDPLTFELVFDGSQGGVKLIDGKHLVVDNHTKLDFEQFVDGKFTIQVRAFDGKLFSEIKTIEIQLVDVARESTTGTDGSDFMRGGAFADQLRGAGGNDTLSGGGGADRLTGGAGEDAFLFDSALSATNRDTITDFDTADDRIFLDQTIFSAFADPEDGPPLRLDGAAFGLGLTASSAEQRILYDRASGKLSYDADGLGGADAQVFAILSKVGSALERPDLTASMFFIV